jgi:hypothetical protein
MKSKVLRDMQNAESAELQAKDDFARKTCRETELKLRTYCQFCGSTSLDTSGTYCYKCRKSI